MRRRPVLSYRMWVDERLSVKPIEYVYLFQAPNPTDPKAPDEIGSKLADALRSHDEAKIRNCNSDIDTLLVFVRAS